jgi:hypothetical protein
MASRKDGYRWSLQWTQAEDEGCRDKNLLPRPRSRCWMREVQVVQETWTTPEKRCFVSKKKLERIGGRPTAQQSQSQPRPQSLIAAVDCTSRPNTRRAPNVCVRRIVHPYCFLISPWTIWYGPILSSIVGAAGLFTVGAVEKRRDEYWRREWTVWTGFLR